MHCPACGVETVEQAIFCHKCGERLNSAKFEVAASPQPADDPASVPAETSPRGTVATPATQDQPEEELWHGGYCSKAMIGAWTLSGLISLGLLIVGLVWARQAGYWLMLLLAMLVPWLYDLVVLCYRRLSVRYLLTTQRLMHESGVLRRVNDRVEVLDMDDITYEQGLLERLVGVGTIRISSADRTHPELLLQGIENVKGVSELFDGARCAERRRRGLHVEQI